MLQQHDRAATEGGYDDWHNCWLLLTQAVQDCPIEDRDVRGTGQLQDVAHQDLVREGGRGRRRGREGEGGGGGREREEEGEGGRGRRRGREGGREGEGERGGRGRERGMEVGGREVGRGRGRPAISCAGHTVRVGRT